METYILNLQASNGKTTYQAVEANTSSEAVNSFFGSHGKWVKMSNSEIPSGTYRSGTYSVEAGYVTVKKPNRVHDWFKLVN